MERKDIRILSPAVSRRIAAGEVIERPASAVRELVENSVDAGASSISVQIEGGGIDLIRVVDDGCGMTRDDLDLLARPHATSKIRDESDLLSVATLGFRGEAMSSLAAVSDLEVTSSTDGESAWRHSSRPGRPAVLEPASGRKGTVVEVRRLFESFPARKRFLKQPRTETLLCTQTFVDRALPHPELSFRLSVDGKSRLSLPPSPLKARVLSALELEEPESFFFECSGEAPGFSYALVLGGLELRRPDRRHLQTFVNGRRVQDFSLQKALEIGYAGFLPGGAFPFAFAFLAVDPSLVDFNIHPAKKEVRFKDPHSIQGALIKTVRERVGEAVGGQSGYRSGYQPLAGFSAGQATSPVEPRFPFGEDAASAPAASDPLSFAPFPPAGLVAAEAAVREAASGYPESGAQPLRPLAQEGSPRAESANSPRILGQVLGTFILVEMADGLLFVDQHAAHERMNFDRLQAGSHPSQEALIPVEFEAEDDEGGFLARSQADLEKAGYRFARGKGRSWSLAAWPAGLPDAGLDIVREILSLRSSPDLLRALDAMTACKSAVKDGDPLDPGAMAELVRFALSAPEPRCPHGRPLCARLGREDLFRLVQRIVR